MPKMTLDNGAPVDVADEKVTVYQSQGYALADEVAADDEPGAAQNVVKRPAKKVAKKAAKKS